VLRPPPPLPTAQLHQREGGYRGPPKPSCPARPCPPAAARTAAAHPHTHVHTHIHDIYTSACVYSGGLHALAGGRRPRSSSPQLSQPHSRDVWCQATLPTGQIGKTQSRGSGGSGSWASGRSSASPHQPRQTPHSGFAWYFPLHPLTLKKQNKTNRYQRRWWHC